MEWAITVQLPSAVPERTELQAALKQERYLTHPYWNDWYFGWGWFLWFGILFLLFSSIGNWSYTYRAHRKYGQGPGKDAFDILNERYARSEISQEQLSLMKVQISKE